MSHPMNRRDGGAELELEITWYQWHDGRWEAWVTDETGRPPRLVRDRGELERFLSQVCGSGNDAHRVKAKRNGS